MIQILCPRKEIPRLRQQKTLLVIEVQWTIQELLLSTFTLFGYECNTINTEQIASLTWIEHCVQMLPDGIVLDIDIRRATLKAPVDFVHAFSARWSLSGHPMPPLVLLTTRCDIRDVLQQEGYRVVTKPFKIRELFDAMSTAIERAQEGRTVVMSPVEETSCEARR